MHTCRCIRCDRELVNLMDGEFQPSGGLAFGTSGHYGSAVFDPMDGSRIEIAVCDQCVLDTRRDQNYVCEISAENRRVQRPLDEALEDMIDEWHEGAGEMSLAVFLGMTPVEYGDFVRDGAIPERMTEGGAPSADPFEAASTLFRSVPGDGAVTEAAGAIRKRLGESLNGDLKSFLNLLDAFVSSIHGKCRSAALSGGTDNLRRACMETEALATIGRSLLSEVAADDPTTSVPQDRKGNDHDDGAHTRE